MAVWRACFDESSDRDIRGGWFVMAGVVADCKQWEAFKKAWCAELDAGKPLHYYHHSDAGKRENPESVFYGWTKEEVQSKRIALAEVVSKETERQFMGGIALRDFYYVMDRARLHDGRHAEYADPYLMGFGSALMLTAKFMDERACKSQKKPTLVFDTLPLAPARTRAYSIYNGFLKAAYDEDGRIQKGQPYAAARWLPPQPLFMDDVPSIPPRPWDIGLQAADLVASAWRLELTAQLHKRPSSPVYRALRMNSPFSAYVWGFRQVDEWKWTLYEHLGLHSRASFLTPDREGSP